MTHTIMHSADADASTGMRAGGSHLKIAIWGEAIEMERIDS